MNKMYYISDSSSLIVLDEKNNSKEIEKNGKYKERLVQENVVELIENRIKELEDKFKKQSIEEVNKKKFIPLATIIAIISSLIVLFSNCILAIAITDFSTDSLGFLTLLSRNFSFMFPLIVTTSLLGAIIDIARKSDYNEYIKKANSDNLELEVLKKILSKEKEKLNKLVQDKSKHRLPAKYEFNKLYLVEDQQQLNNLNNSIKSYRRLGRYLPILYESYKNNTLKDSLYKYGFNLSEDEYKILVSYIIENNTVFSKRKIKKTNIGGI